MNKINVDLYFSDREFELLEEAMQLSGQRVDVVVGTCVSSSISLETFVTSFRRLRATSGVQYEVRRNEYE